MKKSIDLLIFAKSIDGGTGTFIRDFLQIQKLNGIHGRVDIQLMVLERPSYRISLRQPINFFTHQEFYPLHYHLSFRNIRNTYKELVWFIQQFQIQKPDSILTVDAHCLMIASLVKLITHSKYTILATIHNNLSEILRMKSSPILYFFLQYIFGLFLQKADCVVCVSKTLADNIYRSFHLSTKPVVIYNGIEVPSTFHLPTKKRVKQKKVIMMLSRLVEQKDHTTLIDAFYQLQKTFPSVELTIVGDGPLRKFLEDKVRMLGIWKQVKFLGWVNHPEDVLAQADIFVLSSKREGFGYVLLEAMKAGLPVIASDCPFGPSEILGKNTYGLLFPIGDAEALEQALYQLLTDERVYSHFQKASLRRYQMFDLQKMLVKYRNLIRYMD